MASRNARSFFLLLVIVAAGAAPCAAHAERQSGFVDAPGGPVWYEIMGGGDGIPLITLHGGPGGTSCGAQLLAPLGDERAVVRYDQLGSGRSGRPDDPSLWQRDRFVAELDALRQQLGLTEIHLQGHSWGGALAAYYVLETGGEGVRSLTLSSPLISTPRWIEDANLLRARLPEDVQATLREHEAAGTTDSDAYRDAERAFYAEFVNRGEAVEDVDCGGAPRNADIYQQMWGPSEFSATGSLLDFDLTPRLGDIDVPTLFITGEFDEARPETIREFAAAVPGAEFIVIPVVAHASLSRAPEQYREVLRAFVRRHEERPSLAARLDAVFSHLPADGPGCNVGVLRDGEWAYKRGFGISNMELGVPLDGTQRHRMGSVSKQFTAMAVLLLAEEGAIDLEADIRDYLPELPDYGATVSINAMLGHVSGMGDYDLIAGSYEGPAAEKSIDLRSVAGGPFRLGNEDYLTIDEFYDVVTRVPLAQPPEQSFRYSNLAYFLLSMLVERVSGESLRDYAERRIFSPLGMTDTFFSDDPVEIVTNRAAGYRQLEDGSYVTDMTNLFWVGDGGLHTHLDDLRKWDAQFYEPRVGDDPVALLKTMNRPNSDFPARGGRYANGQFVGAVNGVPGFWHSGGWLGTSTYYGRFPEQRTSLMMMCNDAGIDLDALIDGSLDALFPPRESDSP